MKKTPKKGMTLDDLAVITQKGFSEVHENFKEVHKKFEQIDRRFAQIDIRLDRIENLLIRDHDNRITRIEDELRVLKTSFSRK